MTIEEIKEASLEDICTRTSAILKELENADETVLKTLSDELDEIEARKAEITAEKTNTAIDTEAVKSGSGIEIRSFIEKENNKMTVNELRNSPQYIDAYARYIRSGSDKELRKILTENASSTLVTDMASGSSSNINATGELPVPEIVETVIHTAYDELKVLNKCRYVSVKGNMKVGFEISADMASIHSEGAAAPAEENLVLGIATLVPQTIKKWISFSSETVDMDSVSFLRYIYSELTYEIFRKAEQLVVNEIRNAPVEGGTLSRTEATIKRFYDWPNYKSFVEAVSLLRDSAANPVIIMNRQSYGWFKARALDANFGFDVFDGMTVIFNDSLPSVASAIEYRIAHNDATGTNAIPTAGSSAEITNLDYAIVGDLGAVTTNFPNGKNITFKYDDLSLAEQDLVKLVGRMLMSVKVTVPKSLVVINANDATGFAAEYVVEEEDDDTTV